MPRTKYFDLTNKTIGILHVIERTDEYVRGSIKWKCLCACGNETIVRATNLHNGSTKSCGCLRKKTISKLKTTHGLTQSPTYRSWSSMRTRCGNPNYVNADSYSGRGIKICDRWLNSFENFLEDMGERPIGTSLDRINVDGNYEPSNCRWATKKEQANNRRKMRMINKDSFMNFLQKQDFLSEEQRVKLVQNFINFGV